MFQHMLKTEKKKYLFNTSTVLFQGTGMTFSKILRMVIDGQRIQIHIYSPKTEVI